MSQQPKPKPKRKVPRGKALNWTDEDLDRLSQVTPEDIQQAAARWREAASPQYQNLLDAEEVEGD